MEKVGTKMDTEKFIVYSENLVGIDFNRLQAASALLQLVRLTEELGLYHVEFERAPQGVHEIREWGFDDMQFRKGEW